MRVTSFAIGLVAAVLVSVGAAGCMTAGAAGAGAAAAVAYTNRGAESEVQGGMDDVTRRAQAALQKQGVVVAGTEVAPVGAKRVLSGKKGDVDVTVTLTESNDNYTHVDVVAQKSPVDWDKNLAKNIVQDIAKA